VSSQSIRPAYGTWSLYNSRLRDVVTGMTEEHLAIQPAPERWPIWASIGHLACQRVFWLCDFAGEPGAETTPFTNAGDDDLEHVLSGEALADALDSTFRIIEGFLDRWTIDDLDEELRRPEWDSSWVHTRGWVIQRVFTHDVWHSAELNESLGNAGLPQIDLWD
jgi:DinB family protein